MKKIVAHGEFPISPRQMFRFWVEEEMETTETTQKVETEPNPFCREIIPSSVVWHPALDGAE